jgi:hypothetical protein
MLLTIIACIVGVEAQLSQNYKIPSYYGSREQDFLLRGSVYTGNLSSFYWQPAIDHVDNIYYYCDSASHVIWRIDPNRNLYSPYRKFEPSISLLGSLGKAVTETETCTTRSSTIRPVSYTIGRVCSRVSLSSARRPSCSKITHSVPSPNKM